MSDMEEQAGEARDAADLKQMRLAVVNNMPGHCYGPDVTLSLIDRLIHESAALPAVPAVPEGELPPLDVTDAEKARAELLGGIKGWSREALEEKYREAMTFAYCRSRQLRAALAAKAVSVPPAELPPLDKASELLVFNCGAYTYASVQAFRDEAERQLLSARAEIAQLRAALSTPAPTKTCPNCDGKGTEADYVGLEMRPVEVDCSQCKGLGTVASTAAPNARRDEDGWEPCEHCNGTGEYRQRGFVRDTVHDCFFCRNHRGRQRTKLASQPGNRDGGDIGQEANSTQGE